MMKPSEIVIAEEALRGATAMIAEGSLRVNGVQVKRIHRGNVMAVFPPGVAEVVRRYLRGW